MATITEALQALLANRQNSYKDNPSDECLLVTQADGTPVGRLPLTELFQSNWWNIQKNVEGFLRVAGSSNPALTYKHYPHRSDLNPDKGPFSVFYPCLIGNNFTGGTSCGKILHILKKFGAKTDSFGNPAWEGLDGQLYKIDGSQGEVMITNIQSYYQIAGHYTIADLDNLNLDVFLRSLTPFTFHGIVAEEIKPFGWSPDYCVAHSDSDNVTRMHSVYNPDWDGDSYSQIGDVHGRYVCTMSSTGEISETYDAEGTMMNGRGGYHTTSLQLYTGEQYAMNLNDDKTKTYPYFNHTARGAELLFAGLVAEGGTFDTHNKSLFGAPYCINNTMAAADWDESATDAANGIRFENGQGGTTYAGLTYSGTNNLGNNCTYMGFVPTGGYRNVWKIMEAHRAVSFAIQNKIAPLTWFAFEGNKYKYRAVDGFLGPEDGEMTCVVWKVMSGKFGTVAHDPTDTSISLEGKRFDMCVTQALYHGMVLSVSPGWWTSGLVFTQDENRTYTAYIQRDQTKLVKTPTGEVATSDSFSFESVYDELGFTIAAGSGYAKNYSNDALMMPDSDANKTGGALHTYVGKYNYFTGGAASAGKKVVRGFLRGNYFVSSVLSPLCVVANGAPSAAGSNTAFGTCCMIADS